MAVSDGSGLKPTLGAMLALLNQTPPITACQFELWYSKWPKGKWFAQDIQIPGITNKTLSVWNGGFEIPLIMNTHYNAYSISMNILDDEFGYNYAYWRDMVIVYGMNGMKGKPILDGILNEYSNMYQGSSFLLVKLVNDPASPSQHIWRLHNFKPTKIGDIDMGHSKTSLVTFSVEGVFTHITFVQDPNDTVSLGITVTKTTIPPVTSTSQQPPATVPANTPDTTPDRRNVTPQDVETVKDAVQPTG